MKLLKEMLADFGDILVSDITEEQGNIGIDALIYDTRAESLKDSIFVCIKGATFDSHDFAKEAASPPPAI